MKTAVVYDSRFGHTTTVARTLQDKLGADLCHIEETKEAPDDQFRQAAEFGGRLPARLK